MFPSVIATKFEGTLSITIAAPTSNLSTAWILGLCRPVSLCPFGDHEFPTRNECRVRYDFGFLCPRSYLMPSPVHLDEYRPVSVCPFDDLEFPTSNECRVRDDFGS